MGVLGGVGRSLAPGAQQGADVLSLDDDEVPSQRPSSQSGRIGIGARSEKQRARETGTVCSIRGGSAADAAESPAWLAIEAQMPVLIKRGKTSGGGGGEAVRVMTACDQIMCVVTDFEIVQGLSTEQRSTVVKAAAGCLDMKEPVQLMAKAAKVILAVTKGGANLLAVAKLLFRLSKTAANDEMLRAEGICESVVSALRGGGRLESVLSHIGRLSEQCEQEVEAVMLLFAVSARFSPCISIPLSIRIFHDFLCESPNR